MRILNFMIAQRIRLVAIRVVPMFRLYFEFHFFFEKKKYNFFQKFTDRRRRVKETSFRIYLFLEPVLKFQSVIILPPIF